MPHPSDDCNIHWTTTFQQTILARRRNVGVSLQIGIPMTAALAGVPLRLSQIPYDKTNLDLGHDGKII